MLARVSTISHFLTHLPERVFGFFVPSNCPACGKMLPNGEPVGFCLSCYAKLPWWNPAQIMRPDLPKAITGFAAPCLYEGPLREAILNFKFHDQPHLAPTLVKLLLPLVPEIENPLLIPVPSLSANLRRRTYSHAALLARQLAWAKKLPVNVTALKRLRGNAPQNQLTRAQRLRLAGSDFTADPKAVKGRNIILVDDIYTTGATAKACALALKKAGAGHIHVLTLAYTRPGG